ncbi:hypothetical protein SAMN05216233_11978 [Desulfoluna spongiiphila]|uniref:Uncharacterized protein n=2 Tax=Desulfoluna spongiiphila TaxID=419481 RepID=A0A1G5IEE4_9BACT|nr:hypothetical protein SAMN05216233_11978 [Desulfoluna spongiiphila]
MTRGDEIFMRTIPMQYYGYGSARITMPGTVARGARREWLVSPSLLILLLSLTCFAVHKLIFTEPLSLTRPRTIILIPRPAPLPEPTVTEKLSFLKVVKDAAKKRAEPRKKELKRILEKPTPLPKKTSPPVEIKPQRQVLPKKTPLIRPPKALAHRALTEPLPPARTKPAPPTPVPTLSRHISPSGPTQQVPEAPRHKAAPALPAVQPQPLAVIPQPTHHTPRRLPETDLRKPFTPLALSSAPAPVTRSQPKAYSPSPALVATPKRSGPPPTLTQLAAPAALAAGPSHTEGKNTPRQGARPSVPRPVVRQGPTPSVPVAAATGEIIPGQGKKRPQRPSLNALPGGLPTAPARSPSKEVAPDIHALVTIRGSTLVHSLRVTSLKEEIYRKARHMSPEKSPYTYRIRDYTCTVIIRGGATPTALLSFQPDDATFEVVSALERSLPRRTM